MRADDSPLTRERLEELYREWNRREFIRPDPLETLEPYDNVDDREIAALLAASMANGRVTALLTPLKKVLAVMGRSPADYVRHRKETAMERDLEGIVHRFARTSHLASLLSGSGTAAETHGSLEAAFLEGYSADPSGSGDCQNGLKTLETAIRQGAERDPGHLLLDPAKGSACKRLYLFLRWMVRKDAVDPGGWERVSPAALMLPLDTWTHRIARRAGWTSRKSADLKTVREVSGALTGLNPGDPVKYDFALSRFGIRSNLNLDLLFNPGHGSNN